LSPSFGDWYSIGTAWTPFSQSMFSSFILATVFAGSFLGSTLVEAKFLSANRLASPCAAMFARMSRFLTFFELPRRR
jgi:hypothetical protein